MVKYRGGGLLMFFEPFCKSSSRLSNVFFLTPIFTAFVSVYDSTFFGNRIFVLFSSDLEEAIVETGESLSTTKIKFCL